MNQRLITTPPSPMSSIQNTLPNIKNKSRRFLMILCAVLFVIAWLTSVRTFPVMDLSSNDVGEAFNVAASASTTDVQEEQNTKPPVLISNVVFNGIERSEWCQGK